MSFSEGEMIGQVCTIDTPAKDVKTTNRRSLRPVFPTNKSLKEDLSGTKAKEEDQRTRRKGTFQMCRSDPVAFLWQQ